jgi:hypothetical protein
MVYFSASEPTQQSHHAAVDARLSRREWLCGFTGLCAVLSFNIASGGANGRNPMAGGEDWLSRMTRELPDDVIALRQLGESYLVAHPDEADRTQLSRLLAPDGLAVGELAALVRNVERDWISHNVTVVNGWVLARTEARLCAMISLTDPIPA